MQVKVCGYACEGGSDGVSVYRARFPSVDAYACSFARTCTQRMRVPTGYRYVQANVYVQLDAVPHTHTHTHVNWLTPVSLRYNQSTRG